MVERADLSSILGQINDIKASLGQSIDPIAKPNSIDIKNAHGVTEVSDVSFGDLLGSAVNKVQSVQDSANNFRVRYEQGDPSVDLPQVMIQAQKSSVAFDAMVQVRNRLIKSYESIMRMSI